MSSCSGAISGTNNYGCSAMNGNKAGCETGVYLTCCTYVTKGGLCTPKACSVFTNPDMCPGCYNCAGDWTINDARSNIIVSGFSPVTLTGKLIMANGGSMQIGVGAAGGIIYCNDFQQSSTSTITLVKGSIQIT